MGNVCIWHALVIENKIVSQYTNWFKNAIIQIKRLTFIQSEDFLSII